MTNLNLNANIPGVRPFEDTFENTQWRKVKQMQKTFEKKEIKVKKVDVGGSGKCQTNAKTLPEAQRTQGIDSLT